MESDGISSDLILLQMSDSALPVGGFSHSWGFETWVQRGLLKSPADVLSAVETLLVTAIAPQDGTACALAWEYGRDGDTAAFARLNEYLSASRWTAETLAASLSMGKRLTQLSATAWHLSLPPAAMSDQIHHSSAFGWLASAAGISQERAVAAYLYASIVGIVSACVRLVPLGHTEGQSILAQLRTNVAELVPTCLSKRLDDLSNFAPMHEWASREHEFLYSRLFQS